MYLASGQPRGGPAARDGRGDLAARAEPRGWRRSAASPTDRPPTPTRPASTSPACRKVIALKAATGERDPAFGDGGEAALRIPYTGVPVVYDDTLILGSSAFGPGQRHIAPHLNQPRGGGEPTRAWPRALDATTGALRWEFPTLPTESDFGSETWGNQSWRDRIGNNVWAFTLTVDEQRGLVYMPVSSPGSNFYGGDRPGDNLFANSTIAIDIRERRARLVLPEHPPRAVGLQSAAVARPDGHRARRRGHSGPRAGRQVGLDVHPEPRHRRARSRGRGAARARRRRARRAVLADPAVSARAARGVAGEHRSRRHRHRRRHHAGARGRLPRAVGHGRLLQRRTLYAHPVPAGRAPRRRSCSPAPAAA